MGRGWGHSPGGGSGPTIDRVCVRGMVAWNRGGPDLFLVMQESMRER